MRKGKMRGGIDGCLRAARRAIGGPCSEPVVPAASAPRTQTAHLGESDGPAARAGLSRETVNEKRKNERGHRGMPVSARGTMTYLGGRVRGVHRRPPPTSRPSVRPWPGLGSIPTYIQLTCALLVLQTAAYSYYVLHVGLVQFVVHVVP